MSGNNENQNNFKETLKNTLIPAIITAAITAAISIPTTILSVNYSTDKNFESWVKQNDIQYETQLQQEVLKQRLGIIEELSNLFAQKELAEMDSKTFFEVYKKNVNSSLNGTTEDLGKLFEQKLNETMMENKETYKILDEWKRKWSQLETKSDLYFGQSTRDAFHQYWAAGGHWYELGNAKENKEELFYKILNAMRDELNTPLPKHLVVGKEK
ncbi:MULTISPECIES: hypothetical protein [Bacillus cereus group]|uniref:hypothetical protein n=1 Tax=Bacillus cereus group TaxID=86661 RepID=UPI00065DBA16|nr:MULTISPECIES: hypothetical protein [Bacillus cereus group]KMN68154.1 hypothetical protein VK96_22120 [Bacillus cereus]MED3614501.1 hypothetical protein [Bacillus wiedmannii]PEO34993.1 hypothetical protein CN555_23155 [Bacillus wiedmannii]